MSFLTYFRVTFLQGVLPRVTGVKSVLLRLLICMPFIIVLAVCFADSILICAFGAVAFMSSVMYGVTFRTARPSVYCLYPLSPKIKAVYEFAGQLLISVVVGVFAVAFMCLLQLFGILLVAAATGESFVQALSSNVILQQVARLFSGRTRPYGIIFGFGIYFAGFGAASIYNSISSKALSAVFISAFLALNSAAMIMLLAFSMHFALSAGATVFALYESFVFLPHYPVYLWLCFGAGIIMFALSAVLTYLKVSR